MFRRSKFFSDINSPSFGRRLAAIAVFVGIPWALSEYMIYLVIPRNGQPDHRNTYLNLLGASCFLSFCRYARYLGKET